MIKTLRRMPNIQLTVLNEDKFEGKFNKELWIKLNEIVEKVQSGSLKCFIFSGAKDLMMISDSPFSVSSSLSRIGSQASAKL